ALPRTDPRAPAFMLANLVFGGYFTSRLVANIREKRGYTYSPGSAIVHRRLDSLFVVVADVGTDVTAPAMLEIAYELGRMATLRVEQAELDSARRYLSGNISLQLASQGGLASYLDAIGASGLGPTYLRDFIDRLGKVSVDDVAQASEQLFSARRLTSVLVGDASRIVGPLESLGAVEVREAQAG
ncbi:MAG TPA: insulinase family protein, partial [Actinomycetota bacterium]|nr:insulinase family protein [Actinomycetota bacterium]